MSAEPRIVTSQEAQEDSRFIGPEDVRWVLNDDLLGGLSLEVLGLISNLCYSIRAQGSTVATEPDRTRAAVVKALRNAGLKLDTYRGDAAKVARMADEIENGANW